MEQLAITAFTIGIIGSFHCAGMCGPLALSLPLREDSNWAKFSGVFLYNAGRAVTYALFGLMFGLLGQTMSLFGFQQWLSLVMGVLILLFIVVPKFSGTGGKSNKVLYALGQLRSVLGKLFHQKNYRSLFFIGVLNGLLPCGLVYMAAAAATATGSVSNAMLFMIFFAMGTVPVMWCISFFGNFIGLSFRRLVRKAYPYMMVFMASLLILRGMGLGIPYISPAAAAHKIPVCCPKP